MSERPNYREQLRHLCRPDTPSERIQSQYISLTDWEALYASIVLKEYATYGALDCSEEESIALAYAEYIDMSVREEGNRLVDLYAHTEWAEDVLLSAFESDNGILGDTLVQHIEESFEEPETIVE